MCRCIWLISIIYFPCNNCAMKLQWVGRALCKLYVDPIKLHLSRPAYARADLKRMFRQTMEELIYLWNCSWRRILAHCKVWPSASWFDLVQLHLSRPYSDQNISLTAAENWRWFICSFWAFLRTITYCQEWELEPYEWWNIVFGWWFLYVYYIMWVRD